MSTIREPRYRVIAELGRGGMATVYLALAQGPAGFSKLVVLKCIRPELAIDGDFLTMFMDEARIAARLSHPNIVQTNEIIERSGAPVIVMEYLEGQPFSEILRRARHEGQSMPQALQMYVLIEALKGLHYAHEVTDFDGTPLGLVHRDMTPQNIVVTYGGQVKILDFGIAKSSEAQHETRTGVLKGKIRYMAPEQLVGEVVDRRADVFSVGVILWQALTGRPLWHDRSDASVMQSVLAGQFPSPVDVAKHLPPEAQSVVARALTNDRDHRYPTAAAFEESLTNLARLFGPRPDARDLGSYVSGLFTEERERAKVLISDGIKAAKSAAYSGSTEVVFPSQILSHKLFVLGGETEASEPELSYAPGVAPRKWWPKPWLFTGLLLVLGILAIVIGYLASGRAPLMASTASAVFVAAPPSAAGAATAPLAGATAAPTVAAPQGAAPATMQLSASPAEARLFLDGAPLERNPYRGAFRPDGVKHIVRAEAPGYITKQETFVADKDATLALVLERDPSALAAAGRRINQPRVTLRRPTAPSAQAAEPPPSSIDPGF